MRSPGVCLAVVCASVLSGCVRMQVRHVGTVYSFPEQCTLEYQIGDMDKVTAMIVKDGYKELAAISIAKGDSSLTDPIKAKVRPEACKLGGTTVVMTDSASGSYFNWAYVSLVVLRKPGLPEGKIDPTGGSTEKL